MSVKITLTATIYVDEILPYLVASPADARLRLQCALESRRFAEFDGHRVVCASGPAAVRVLQHLVEQARKADESGETGAA